MSPSQPIRGTPDASALFGHMGVNHRGFDMGVTQQGLYRSNIGPLLKKMGGKGMAKAVAVNPFLNPGALGGAMNMAR